MHPILTTVFGVPIHWYGVLGAVGFLVVCFIAMSRAHRAGIDRERVADLIFATAIAGIVGSRALYVILNPSQLHGWHDWVNLRTGGLVFYGALLTGLPVGALIIWRYDLPLFKLADIFATALPLGHAIARVGCLMAGCCFGRPTTLPWGVTYSDPLTPAPHGVPLHPTQIYEALYLLAIFGICNWFYPRRRFDGQVMALYLLLYAGCRTLNEFLRGDGTRGWVLEGLLGQHVSTSQGLSVVVALIALVVFAIQPSPNRKVRTE
jgi:phosphatidylglycerol:prolipoprotein diacylglycerol transferase